MTNKVNAAEVKKNKEQEVIKKVQASEDADVPLTSPAKTGPLIIL